MSLTARVQGWLQIATPDKPVVFRQVYNEAGLLTLSYWLQLIFSAGIATLGLVQNSAAVIIGAMLISPMMGPIMGTGLGLAIGNVHLTLKSVLNLLLSIAVSIALSAALVWLLPFHSVTDQILVRTRPNLLDLIVALLSGLAGSVAVARSNSGSGVTTMPGVAIAVALMPPLCTVGFGLGFGADVDIMRGAGLLFLTNLVAIVASAFAVFVLTGMNCPDVMDGLSATQHRQLVGGRLSRTRVGRAVAQSAALHWRGLLVLVLLASVMMPLRSALVQLTSEALARETVQRELKSLVPADSIVSQQLEVGRSHLLMRLITTHPVGETEVGAAERRIADRTHRAVDLQVHTVASETEVAQLMQRMQRSLQATAAAPPEAPKPVSLAALDVVVRARVEPALASIWPPEAPVQAFSLGMGSAGLVLTVRYTMKQPLPPTTVALLQRDLAERLESPALTLQPVRAIPSKSAAAKRRGRR